MQTCPKCSGSGTYLHFGMCYQCRGTGKVRPVATKHQERCVCSEPGVWCFLPGHEFARAFGEDQAAHARGERRQ